MRKRIIETDNYGRDYPDERFLPIPFLEEKNAETIADILNNAEGKASPRYWMVVDLDYKLQPGRLNHRSLSDEEYVTRQ